MLRRDFIKVGGAGLAALPLLSFDSLGGRPPAPESRESTLWIHGSPYAGHADPRPSFRGLTPAEALAQIVHFRTAEPYRRTILFQL